MRISDWSSDVCSSDLLAYRREGSIPADCAYDAKIVPRKLIDRISHCPPSCGALSRAIDELKMSNATTRTDQLLISPPQDLPRPPVAKPWCSPGLSFPAAVQKERKRVV